MRKVLVIAPTYNEKGSIEKIIEEIFSQSKSIANWELNVLIVDSKSEDGTGETVRRLQKKYSTLHLLETAKEGLGKAYLRGFTYAVEKINPYLIIQMDADGQHDPKKIPEFVREIEKGSDFVIGTRYSKGGSIPQNWGIHRKIFSVGAQLVARFGFMKPEITEWTNGYRAIKTWIIKNAFGHIKNYSGYVFQIAMIDFALKNNARISEIPIDFKERKTGKSKINAIQYSFQSFGYVLGHSPFIKFVIVGFIGFGVDFGFAYIFINRLHIAKAWANVMSAEIAIISNFFLNNFWSFRHKKIEGGLLSYVFKFITFNLVSSGSLLIQGGGLFLALKFFGDKSFVLASFHLQSWILYKIVIIFFLVIPYSYILYNKIIWKNK